MTVSNTAPELAIDAALYVTSATHIDNYVLAANTAETITRPTNGNVAIFSGNGDFWVAYGRTAAVPAADSTAGTNSELNPTVRRIHSATSISIISESAVKVSVMWLQ
jgi:hypothetical protein